MANKTFLYDEHVKLNAKMVDFAGWDMPVQYTSIKEEHNNVRNNAGLFDVSHMGEIFVYGPDALKFLQTLVPQDVSKVIDKKAKYCQFTTQTGGIVDDLFIYKLKENNYLLVVNASRLEADYDWMVKNSTGFNVVINNLSNDLSMVALQGPKATDIIDKIGLKKEDQPHTMFIMQAELLGDVVYISRTGYTGEDGFEIIIENDKVAKLWNTLLEEGKEFGILPIGLGARDTLRLEAAMSLYGHELNEEITPVEATLAWSIDKDKVEDYIGKEVIQNQLQNGSNKKLIAFKMVDRAIARSEYEIYSNDEKIGYVTSGGYAPFLEENIGLGYIETSKGLKIGDSIQIMVRNKLYNAVITSKKFIEKHNRNN